MPLYTRSTRWCLVLSAICCHQNARIGGQIVNLNQESNCAVSPHRPVLVSDSLTLESARPVLVSDSLTLESAAVVVQCPGLRRIPPGNGP
jgi:hypothetical protein